MIFIKVNKTFLLKITINRNIIEISKRIFTDDAKYFIGSYEGHLIIKNLEDDSDFID